MSPQSLTSDLSLLLSGHQARRSRAERPAATVPNTGSNSASSRPAAVADAAATTAPEPATLASSPPHPPGLQPSPLASLGPAGSNQAQSGSPAIAVSNPAAAGDTLALATSTAPAPSPSQPAQISRGAAPWSDARVEALILEGSIQASWLPDIRATALTHLQIQNAKQRQMLRFSNAIANTGAGTWQVRRGTLISDPDQIAYAESLGLDPGQLAITAQELVDADGQIAAVIGDAAFSEFHPEHKHFHIGETAEFCVERFDQASDSWDPITGLEVVKTTFCLIDVNQIEKVPDADPDHYDIIKSPANDNLYNDCFADVQGIQAGWIDRYNHSLPGQEVDITDLPAGTYRILSIVNPAGWFLESDYSNNVGWTAFDLSRDSNGNPKLRTIAGATGGIWFDSTPNGMG